MFSELTESNQIKYTRQGGTCVRVWACDTLEEAYFYAPKPGTGDPLYPNFIVDELTIDGIGVGYIQAGVKKFSKYKVTCSYILDYKKLYPKSLPKVTLEATIEMLNTGEGRTWTTTGRKISVEQMSQAIPYPVVPVTIEQSLTAAQLVSVSSYSLMGKVNQAEMAINVPYTSTQYVTLLTAAAGTLLYEGCSYKANYNYETFEWDFVLTHKLLYREQTHNMLWRPPEYVKDQYGVIQYYQNYDAAAPYYTANAALYGLPVPMAGAPGTAGWDTPDPLIYPYGDFSGMLI